VGENLKRKGIEKEKKKKETSLFRVVVKITSEKEPVPRVEFWRELVVIKISKKTAQGVKKIVYLDTTTPRDEQRYYLVGKGRGGGLAQACRARILKEKVAKVKMVTLQKKPLLKGDRPRPNRQTGSLIGVQKKTQDGRINLGREKFPGVDKALWRKIKGDL